MKKQSTLSAGANLKLAAKGTPLDVPEEAATDAPAKRGKRKPGAKTMIGGMFDPVVRRTLAQIALEPENDGRSLQDLLGEAINDLAVKYNKPQPYQQDQ
jgi:hypothetical protein